MKPQNVTNVTFLLVCLLTAFEFTESMVIWRCPEFNLLKCKSLPKKCRSFRMIYIGHGDMECPGCLVCADYHGVFSHTSQIKKLKNRKKRLKNRKRRAKLRIRLRNLMRRKENKIKLISNKLNEKINDIRFKS